MKKNSYHKKVRWCQQCDYYNGPKDKDFLEHLLTYTYNRQSEMSCRVIYNEILAFLKNMAGAKGDCEVG